MIRPAVIGDLPAIERIQSVSPGAARWDAAACLAHDCRVMEEDGRVVGFIVTREIAGEYEILNLAVDPECRRRRLGTILVRDALTRSPGLVFLEVRESNRAAISLYAGLGFLRVGRRRNYYHEPDEAAIVMRLQSC